MRRLALLGVVLSLASLIGLARAQTPDWDAAESQGALDRPAERSASELRPVELDPYHGHLQLETAFFRGRQRLSTTTLISPLLSFGYRISSALQLGARFGLAGAIVDGSSPTIGGPVPSLEGSRLRVGNPELTAGYHHAFVSWPRVVEVYVGTGVSLPLASGARVSAIALDGASAIRGRRDSWLWLPDTLGILLPSVRVSMTRHAAELGASADLVLLVPTGDTFIRQVELRGQLRFSAAYHVAPPLRLGAAFSIVGQLSGGSLALDPGRDDYQSSLDLFVRLDSGGGLAELRFTTNLDKPSGFSFDDQGVWGLRLLLGVRLP